MAEAAELLSAALSSVSVDSRYSTRASAEAPLAGRMSASGGSSVAGIELGLGRSREILLSAQELTAPTSLEHVLAREIYEALGATQPAAKIDVPRLQSVLAQARESMQASPQAWTNQTTAVRLFQIGSAYADASAEAATRVYDALKSQVHSSASVRLQPVGRAVQCKATVANVRTKFEEALEALNCCARLHSLVVLPMDASVRLNSIAAEVTKSLLGTTQLRLDKVGNIVSSRSDWVGTRHPPAKAASEALSASVATLKRHPSSTFDEIDPRWRLGTLRADDLAWLGSEVELADRAIAAASNALRPRGVGETSQSVDSIVPAQLLSQLAAAKRALKEVPHAHKYVRSVRSKCKELGLPQPEALLRGADGTSGLLAILSHVENAQKLAVRAAATISPVGVDGNTLRGELNRMSGVVATACAERDRAREDACRMGEASSAQIAEIRRLTELIEGYQRRLGERAS